MVKDSRSRVDHADLCKSRLRTTSRRQVEHSHIERSGMKITQVLARVDFKFRDLNLKLFQSKKSIGYHIHQMINQSYTLKTSSTIVNSIKTVEMVHCSLRQSLVPHISSNEELYIC